ncbi:TMEM43 family protein [uncultured Legionella sp.]|uniref:TMEM43 family protein n=1 Tax=uncultured Legionella sp. TaxID=210934 RepID=UPI002637723D|nr:TMEM43 family protein [uncultured Legionella sp.]
MTEEITTRSWWSRIKDAFIGIFIGIGLIIGAIVLIFWNERHSLHTAQSLEQTHKILISVPNSPINKENNFKVVYLSGQATTNDQLEDSTLGITINAISLNRKVEMYQWEEKVETKTESQMGGSEKQIKTYSYDKIWSANLINSSNFKNPDGHQNPDTMPIHSLLQYAKTVTLGEFTLPDELIRQINVSEPVDLSKVNKETLKSQYNKPIHLTNNELYLGQEPQNPRPGDIRINLTAAYPQIVSIIGQQTGNTLQAYLAPAGESVFLLSTGQQSADQMIEQAQSKNKMMAWILRLVSLFMLIGGFSLILNPLVVLSDVLPFLGRIVGFGTGFISFICGLGIWIVVTAIAWFATRPFLSIGLIAIVISGGYLIIKMRAKKIPSPPNPRSETTSTKTE